MNNPQTIFLSIAISIGVFLLLREVFCWYFKINKRISLLSDIKDELVKANEGVNPSREPAQSSSIPVKKMNDHSFDRANKLMDKVRSDRESMKKNVKENFWRAK
jgi:hypothetical protein